MTGEEQGVWDTHFENLKRLLAEGTLILAGPTLGRVNTGITIIEAQTRRRRGRSWSSIR